MKILVKYEENIFIGVIYWNIVRYYLLGIDKKFIKFGIVNFIECKGVKIIYLMLFILKYYWFCLFVKVNILLEFVKIVEVFDFWFEGVWCRWWMSNREWEEKCVN